MGRSSVLVLGGGGQLAFALRQVSWPKGIEAVYLAHTQCDVSSPEDLKSALDTFQPAVVINTAAYTNVDQAEAHPADAQRINAEAPRHLANACERRSIWLIHISTDYVFDGKAQQPYIETAATGPLNVYGETKLSGDLAIRQNLDRHVIFRTSWLYSERQGNFVTKIRELAHQRPELNVVADQIGCPTYAGDLAMVIVGTLEQCLDNDFRIRGLCNCVGQGSTSWFDFAQHICTLALPEGRRPLIRPVSAAEYAAPAIRPAYSVLDTARLKNVFGVTLPNWHESLAKCLLTA